MTAREQAADVDVAALREVAEAGWGYLQLPSADLLGLLDRLERAEAAVRTAELAIDAVSKSARDLRTQLAPLIAERVRAAQAEALREAADALNTTDHATETALMGIDHVIDWLRDRAAALNPGPRP